MKGNVAGLFLILIVAIPCIVRAQVDVQLPVPERRIGSGQQVKDPWLQEGHYTDVLLNSEAGLEARALYRQLKESGATGRLQRAAPPVIGETRAFNVIVPELSTLTEQVYEEVDFVLRRSGEKSEIWVAVSEYGPKKVTDGILDQILHALEEETPPESVNPSMGIIDLERSVFSTPEDEGQLGKLKVLITNLKDGWTPQEGGAFIGGLFNPVDLLPDSLNEYSNFGDIIYINSTPGIYRTDIDAEPIPRLNTIAHEYQHVIHGKYDGLSTFQNEGQSGLAEILTGYPSRTMSFLNVPGELSGNMEVNNRWFYRWSSDTEQAGYDYQRSQLFHSYLEERLGTDAVGALTRSIGYEDVESTYRIHLDGAANGLTLGELINDFYLSIYRNRSVSGAGMERINFSRPQFSNLRVSVPGVLYNQETYPWWVFNREQELSYGGANYTQWFGVESLEIDFRATTDIRQTLMIRSFGETNFEIMPVGSGGIRLEDGPYEEIVLVSVNVSPDGSEASPDDSRTFSYSAEWINSGLSLEERVHHSSAEFYYPLPDIREDGVALNAFASRISPEFDSGVQTVRISVNNHPAAVAGSGQLVLELYQAREVANDSEQEGAPNESYLPQDYLTEPVASQMLPFEILSPGSNYIWLDREEWRVTGGREYFIVLRFVGNMDDAYVEFLFDSGSRDVTDTNYYPPRTLFGNMANGEDIGWSYFLEYGDPGDENQNAGHNNVLIGASLVGYRESEIPDFPAPPASEQFHVAGNYPNPFGGSTSVEFNIPEEADIKITVHDVLGREVRELFNGTASQGLHTAIFDPRELSSGVYYFRMIHPDGTSTRPAMYIRD